MRLHWWHDGQRAITGRCMSNRPKQSYVTIYFTSGRYENFVLTGSLADYGQFESHVSYSHVIEMRRENGEIECIIANKIESFKFVENWDGE